VAPVERIAAAPPASTAAHPVQPSVPAPAPEAGPRPEARPETEVSPFATILAQPHELPHAPHTVVRTLFLLFQAMYLGFYIGALANLPEIDGLLAPLPHAPHIFLALIVTAAVLIPVRAFVLSMIAFRAPRAREKFLRLWPFLLPLDELWSLAPFLLLHHIDVGLALACTALLVYSPFAQRSLVLMGAAGGP
jgi:hypothetical protein